MNYLDYAIIAILALALITGLFKGFVKPIISIISWGVIIGVIYFLGQQVADLLGTTPLGDLLQGLVRTTLEPLGELGTENVVQNSQGVWVIASSGVALTDAVVTIPDFILNIVSGSFQANVSLADNLTATLANYVLLAISAVTIMLAVGIIFAIISAIINRFVNVQNAVLNRCLGAVLQLIIPCMSVFLVLFFLNIVASFVNIEGLNKIIEESAIVKVIGGFNPFELIIGAVMK